MDMTKIENSLSKLIEYIEKEEFKGYDPYDTLNSWFPFRKMGKKIPVYAIQFQKRNPVNIRPFFGIKKDHNPKGLGLLLKAFCLAFKRTNKEQFKIYADNIIELLLENTSQGYSGACWGYNFDWASPGNFLAKYTPSVVVTSFVVDGLYEYYKLTQKDEVKKLIFSAEKYILNDIPVTNIDGGISFAYTHLSNGCCYNASLLAAEILAKVDNVRGSFDNEALIDKAIKFVLSKQKKSGVWFYSYDPKTNTERKQIDFHQGFVLTSLFNLRNLCSLRDDALDQAIDKGMNYYYKEQFESTGRSLWRIPRKYPTEIHNQAQGIITFSKINKDTYGVFAEKILDWTIDNMQASEGYFFYQKHKCYTNKIPYMRWSQAWMLLAFEEYFNGIKND